MERAIVVLGCDLTDSGATLGLETIARCTRALNRYHELIGEGIVPSIIMSPGMPSKTRYPAQKQTMALMMMEWFYTHGVSADSLHAVFSPLTWGTRSEVNTALDFILFWGMKNDGAVEFISSTYHLPRIALIAKRILVAAKLRTNAPPPVLNYIGAKYYSRRRILLEVRNLIGEYLLGFFHPHWYDFSQTKWCS